MLPHIDTNAFADWVRGICGEQAKETEQHVGYQLSLGALFGCDPETNCTRRGPVSSDVRCWPGGGALTIWLTPRERHEGGGFGECGACGGCGECGEPVIWHFEVNDRAERPLNWWPPQATAQILLGRPVAQAHEVVTELLRRVVRELGLVGVRWPREPLRRLARQTHRLFVHLHELEIGHAARTFAERVDADPAVAWWVFGEVRADAAGAGRLLQLLEVCPALLSLLRWLELQGEDEAVAEVLGGVRSGRRLPGLLRLAVQRWAAALGLEQGDPGLRAARLRAQATLVRRLAFIPSLGTWRRPLPEGANVDDVPTKLWRQRRWLTVLRHRGLRGCELSKLSDDQRRGLGAFFSRHAVRLHALAQRLYGLRRVTTVGDDLILSHLLARLLPYIEHEGRVPGVRSNPDRWVRAARRWYDRMQWGETALPLGAELPRLPRTRWDDDGLQIRQLVTRDEIIDEGARMRHCIAAMAHHALEHPIYYFHADDDGAELTASVIRLADDRGYELDELCRPDNRPAKAPQRRRFERWVSGLRDDLMDPNTQRKEERR